MIHGILSLDARRLRSLVLHDWKLQFSSQDSLCLRFNFVHDIKMAFLPRGTEAYDVTIHFLRKISKKDKQKRLD